MLREQLTLMYEQSLAAVLTWAPRLLVMIALVVIGLIVARLTERAFASALTRVHFDKLLARSGIDHTLRRIGVRAPIDRLLPRITFYLLLIVFARAAADVVGLTAVSEAIAVAMAYVPNVAAAVLILVLGNAIAQVAGRAVEGAAEESGVQFAGAMGAATAGFILFVLAMMAIAQLQIDTRMVQLAATAILAGVALGFGLAFGLGCRDVMRGVLAGFYARQILEIGNELTVGDARGKLVSITPTQLLLETETDFVSVPNVVHLERGGRQPK